MIIITGVSGGIGKYLLGQFLEQTDEQIVAMYNNTEPLFNYENPKLVYIKADLTSESEVGQIVNEHFKIASNIKLIHCAGLSHNSMLHKTQVENWRKVFAVNLDSAFILTKYLLPIMREQSFGRIIFFSSIVPQIGVVGTASYSASKSGLWGLMKALVKENASKGITCNTLNLGYFNIGMIKDVPETILNEIIKTIPSQKLGEPIDIFNAVKFIISSDYLTGAQIDINGGLY